MATTLINKSQNVNDQDGYAGYRFRLEVILNSYNSSAATYNVTINHYVKGDTATNHKYHGLTQPNSIIRAYVGDTKIVEQITNVNQITGSETLGGTWTGNIQANADGNLTVRYLGKYAANKTSGYLPKTNTVEETIAMPTIPRYANVTTFNVTPTSETSMSVYWAADVACDWAQYRIRQSGGSYGSWIDCGQSFNINSLSANTTYIVQVQVRRQDSGLWSSSGENRQTTYAYPYVTSAPNFEIGNTANLVIHNPLNRSCKIYIKNPLDTEKELATITGVTTQIPNTSEWNTFFYNGIPNSKNGLYRVRIVTSAVSQDTTFNGGTYNVNEANNKPITTNMTATYTADLTNLTNNNQTVINSASTITYTITNGATAQNGASISKYTVVWGNAEPKDITNISNPASLVRGNGDTISVTIVDSRGITNTYSTHINEVINYTLPTGLAISPDRLNGVDESVYLDVSGTIYYDKFGTNGVSNKITSIKYSIANESAQNVSVSLSSLAYSQQSLDTQTQRFSIVDAPITRDGVSAGFDTTKTYNITVVVTDTSGNTATISGIIKDGKFAMIKGRDSNGDYHTGINGLPDNNYALKVHGEISADNVYNPYPVGAIYISDNSTSPASLFGGTWEQLDGYYLYAGNGYSKTTYTGKNAQSHTLTANQSGLRQHNHGASGSYSGSNFYIRHGNTAGRDIVAGGTNTSVEVGVGASWSNGIEMTSYTHNIDRVNIGGTVGVSVNNQGPWDAAEGHPHNIATLEIYAWRRTA